MLVCYSWHENGVCSKLNFIHIILFGSSAQWTLNTMFQLLYEEQAKIVLVIICAELIMIQGAIFFYICTSVITS